MTQTHPITPPEELLEQWYWTGKSGNWQYALTLAYRAGADQELEACCHEVQTLYSGGSRLRAARRPKPTTLKEQALELVSRIEKAKSPWEPSELETIRRALEALDD
jgi:hypothetical protein